MNSVLVDMNGISRGTPSLKRNNTGLYRNKCFRKEIRILEYLRSLIKMNHRNEGHRVSGVI